jgi:hypothetical protein
VSLTVRTETVRDVVVVMYQVANAPMRTMVMPRAIIHTRRRDFVGCPTAAGRVGAFSVFRARLLVFSGAVVLMD